jgi:hypothetical protein
VRWGRIASIVAIACLAAAIVHADPPPAGPPAPRRADPIDFVARPLVLARGEIEAQLTVETSLRARSVGTPLSLSPDVWVGITPRLTVGLIHSNQSVDQIDTGDSFCLRGNERECDRTYQGSGVDARYGWRSGPLAVAPRLRLLLRDVEPAKPAVTTGALVRWTHGRFAVTTDPYLRLGLANRDEGNRAALFVPVWLAVQPTCNWMLALHVGYDSDLAVARDGWNGPFGIIAAVHPIAPLEIAAEFGFRSLFGPQNRLQDRVLMFTIGWRQQLAR